MKTSPSQKNRSGKKALKALRLVEAERNADTPTAEDMRKIRANASRFAKATRTSPLAWLTALVKKPFGPQRYVPLSVSRKGAKRIASVIQRLESGEPIAPREMPVVATETPKRKALFESFRANVVSMTRRVAHGAAQMIYGSRRVLAGGALAMLAVASLTTNGFCPPLPDSPTKAAPSVIDNTEPLVTVLFEPSLLPLPDSTSEGCGAHQCKIATPHAPAQQVVTIEPTGRKTNPGRVRVVFDVAKSKITSSQHTHIAKQPKGEIGTPMVGIKGTPKKRPYELTAMDHTQIAAIESFLNARVLVDRCEASGRNCGDALNAYVAGFKAAQATDLTSNHFVQHSMSDFAGHRESGTFPPEVIQKVEGQDPALFRAFEEAAGFGTQKTKAAPTPKERERHPWSSSSVALYTLRT